MSHTHCKDMTCPECHKMKDSPRDEQLVQDVTRRLNRICGQLGGVRDMVQEGRYCGDVLVQLAAAQSALKGVSSIILQDHMETCVVEQIQAGNTEVVDELVQLLRKFS